ERVPVRVVGGGHGEGGLPAREGPVLGEHLVLGVTEQRHAPKQRLDRRKVPPTPRRRRPWWWGRSARGPAGRGPGPARSGAGTPRDRRRPEPPPHRRSAPRPGRAGRRPAARGAPPRAAPRRVEARPWWAAPPTCGGVTEDLGQGAPEGVVHHH